MFKDLPPVTLAETVLRELVRRTGVPAADIGDVIFETMCIGGGQGIAAVFERVN